MPRSRDSVDMPGSSNLRSAFDVRDQIDIEAIPQRVWDVFTDFASFPSWNPFIRQLDGDLLPGRKLRVILRLGRRRMRFRPEVTVVRPEREIRWRVRRPIRGIFEVERVFEFEPVGPSTTRFVQWEVARGLMAPVVMAIMGPKIAHGYAALSLALKGRVEDPAESGSGKAVS